MHRCGIIRNKIVDGNGELGRLTRLSKKQKTLKSLPIFTITQYKTIIRSILHDET